MKPVFIVREPKIHSHIDDALPDDHPLAFVTVYCDFEACREMLHAGNNECMVTWVETGKGNFCLPHFCELAQAEGGVLEDDWELPPERVPVALLKENEYIDRINHLEAAIAGLRCERMDIKGMECAAWKKHQEALGPGHSAAPPCQVCVLKGMLPGEDETND